MQNDESPESLCDCQSNKSTSINPTAVHGTEPSECLLSEVLIVITIGKLFTRRTSLTKFSERGMRVEYLLSMALCVLPAIASITVSILSAVEHVMIAYPREGQHVPCQTPLPVLFEMYLRLGTDEKAITALMASLYVSLMVNGVLVAESVSSEATFISLDSTLGHKTMIAELCLEKEHLNCFPKAVTNITCYPRSRTYAEIDRSLLSSVHLAHGMPPLAHFPDSVIFSSIMPIATAFFPEDSSTGFVLPIPFSRLTYSAGDLFAACLVLDGHFTLPDIFTNERATAAAAAELSKVPKQVGERCFLGNADMSIQLENPISRAHLFFLNLTSHRIALRVDFMSPPAKHAAESDLPPALFVVSSKDNSNSVESLSALRASASLQRIAFVFFEEAHYHQRMSCPFTQLRTIHRLSRHWRHNGAEDYPLEVSLYGLREHSSSVQSLCISDSLAETMTVRWSNCFPTDSADKCNARAASALSGYDAVVALDVFSRTEYVDWDPYVERPWKQFSMVRVLRALTQFTSAASSRSSSHVPVVVLYFSSSVASLRLPLGFSIMAIS